LERPDEMPARADHGEDLGTRFLNPVLTERCQSGRDCLPDALGRESLGDRDELDPGRITPRATARRGDPFENALTCACELGLLVRLGYFRRRKLGISRSSAS
jgi:hypothetical protein